MAHKGMREFTGEELSGVALGQNGFHVLAGDAEFTASGKGCEYWIAIKAINGDANIEAQSVIKDSDDFTTNSGTYNSGSSAVELLNGDIIYGAFDKIDVASGHYVIAYIGR